jgi:GLPGLI family protein
MLFICRMAIPILLLLGETVHAQDPIFLSEGKIEFEKRVNLMAVLGNDVNWPELTKRGVSQFRSVYFDLLFTRDKTLYKPGRENPDNSSGWQQPAEDNVVWSDLEKKKMVSQKRVFEEIFLLQDSLRRIEWKMTDETRTIAGFNCRRANAVILDSIFVVAFYTDEILTTGGPESFTGLPGMILGLALPHQHTTWFATKVQAIPITDAQMAVPQKGKPVSYATLQQILLESLKSWDKRTSRRYIEGAIL